jgi:CheY-like chemotaxis protein
MAGMVDRPQKILVVEDDDELRDSLLDLLEMEGFWARGAANGVSALEQLEAGYLPDVILLDLVMPVMNGWQFRQEVANHPDWSQIPVIVITAAEGSSAPTATPVGSYLRKPFGFSHLLDLVSHARSVA